MGARLVAFQTDDARTGVAPGEAAGIVLRAPRNAVGAYASCQIRLVIERLAPAEAALPQGPTTVPPSWPGEEPSEPEPRGTTRAADDVSSYGPLCVGAG